MPQSYQTQIVKQDVADPQDDKLSGREPGELVSRGHLHFDRKRESLEMSTPERLRLSILGWNL
jgi:hypothetical protein